MAEVGKLLSKDLKDIPKRYPHASGKKKIRPSYYLWVIAPFILFIVWSSIAIRTPKSTNKIESDRQQKEVEKIVQSTNARMTEVAVIGMLAKQLTPENKIKIEMASEPNKQPDIQNTKTPVYDVLETGLNPDEVMSVLQNLPPAGRYRMDGQNEMVVYAKDYKISFYFPPYGGINCNGRYACSYTASGKRVMEGVGYYAACPPSLPFGTKIIILGKEWICEDRGGAITEEWLDLLYPYMPYGLFWSQTVTVKVIGKINEYPTITPTIEYPQYPTITKTPAEEQYPTITKTPVIYPTATKTPGPTQENTKTPEYTNTPENSKTVSPDGTIDP